MAEGLAEVMGARMAGSVVEAAGVAVEARAILVDMRAARPEGPQVANSAAGVSRVATAARGGARA